MAFPLPWTVALREAVERNVDDPIRERREPCGVLPEIKGLPLPSVRLARLHKHKPVHDIAKDIQTDLQEV